MSPIPMLIILFLLPFLIIAWNRHRVKGKILCYFVRKDKSVLGKLCSLRSAFVIWEDRAYDIHPSLVRVAKFPMGWPALLQELVPCALYDEEDAIPLDWINLQSRNVKERSMELRTALDENWLKKLVHETAAEGGTGFSLNFRKLLPFIVIGVGLVGLLAILFLR